jgi:hypothetical protein
MGSLFYLLVEQASIEQNYISNIYRYLIKLKFIRTLKRTQ